ncbi:hypothetical protein D3C87_1321890 [compost metagenome]
MVIVDCGARDRILLQQRHHNHARFEIIADETADDAGTGNVQAQLLDPTGRAVVGVRHDRATTEALLRDLGPAHGRRPQ